MQHPLGGEANIRGRGHPSTVFSGRLQRVVFLGWSWGCVFYILIWNMMSWHQSMLSENELTFKRCAASSGSDERCSD